jgi:AcrR family transcriptional regulator
MEKRVRLTRALSQMQTRERLLVAARQVFARLGYGGASVDMIAAEAGYSKGAVYSNFASKDAIFFELLDRAADEEIAVFSRIMAMDAPDARKALALWLDEMHADDDLAMLTMELALHARRNPQFADRFYAYEQRLTNFHATFFTNLFAQQGRRPPLDPVALALALRTLASAINLALPPTKPGDRNKAGEIIQDLLDFMIDPRSLPAAAAAAAEPNGRKSPSRRTAVAAPRR